MPSHPMLGSQDSVLCEPQKYPCGLALSPSNEFILTLIYIGLLALE